MRILQAFPANTATRRKEWGRQAMPSRLRAQPSGVSGAAQSLVAVVHGSNGDSLCGITDRRRATSSVGPAAECRRGPMVPVAGILLYQVPDCAPDDAKDLGPRRLRAGVMFPSGNCRSAEAMHQRPHILGSNPSYS